MRRELQAIICVAAATALLTMTIGGLWAVTVDVEPAATPPTSWRTVTMTEYLEGQP